VTQETLDETIDRVAGEMTAVAADSRLAARVRERTHEQRRPSVKPALAAVCVLGVVVIAIVLWPAGERPTSAAPELVANAVIPIAPLLPTMSSDLAGSGVVVGGTPVPPSVEAGTLVASNLERPTSVPPVPATAVAAADAEAGAGGPAPLAVAELTIPPVVRPDAVAIAPLDVAPLDVPGLQLTEEPKEQK